MHRYFIKLAYKGTKFHGWQCQPNAISVQEELIKCMSLLLSSKIELTGCGRTDTGVHASEFYAHFDIAQLLTEKDCNQLINKLNRFIDKDIVIYAIFKVAPDLHARFSATSRTYNYFIHTYKNPFINESSWFLPVIPDVVLMNNTSALLLEYTDFTSFAKLHSDSKTNLCKIIHAEWIVKNDSEMVFTITADRFLRNMVRSLVSTLVDVGTGRLSIEDFKSIIESKNRANASSSAKAYGLFLVRVEYPAF